MLKTYSILYKNINNMQKRLKILTENLKTEKKYVIIIIITKEITYTICVETLLIKRMKERTTFMRKRNYTAIMLSILMGMTIFTGCGKKTEDEFDSGVQGDIDENASDVLLDKKDSAYDGNKIPEKEPEFKDKNEMTNSDPLTIENEFVYSGESINALLSKLSEEYQINTEKFQQNNCDLEVTTKTGKMFKVDIDKLTSELYNVTFWIYPKEELEWAWNGFDQNVLIGEFLEVGTFNTEDKTGEAYFYAPDAISTSKTVKWNEQENPCPYITINKSSIATNDMPLTYVRVTYHLIPLNTES